MTSSPMRGATSIKDDPKQEPDSQLAQELLQANGHIEALCEIIKDITSSVQL